MGTLSSFVVIALLVGFVVVAGPGYGAAVWETLAGGFTRKEQEAHLLRIGAPSFEAGTIWLALVVFAGGTLYPRGIHAMGTSLADLSSVMVLGIFVRALSLVVRSRVLSGLSLVAPFSMGLITGLFSSGAVYVSSTPLEGPAVLWPILVGAFSVAVFAWLAAVRVGEAAAPEDPDSGERAVHAFRSRALLSFFSVAVLGLSLVFFAWTHATEVYREIIGGPIAWALQGVIVLVSIAALHMLIRERWRTAARLATLQTALIIGGGIAAVEAAVPAVFEK